MNEQAKSKKQQRRERSDGVRAPKMRRQRQAMIQGAITRGVFRSRKDVKGWIKKEFGLREPISEVSTEYSFTDGQLKLWYMWLRYFNGKGKKPRKHTPRSRAGNRRVWRIGKLKEALGWNTKHLTNFIQKQCGLDHPKMPQSLTANEASDVITGMDRILAERPFKRKHQLNNE